MQTFLPFDSFALSAQCLDNKRLGKQRVEAWQIFQALRNGTAWQNHPAVRMWRGHEQALLKYGRTICLVWRAKGFKDTLLERFEAELKGETVYPPWWGNKRLHDSHKMRLFEKDPIFYAPFSKVIAEPCCIGCNYYWPTHVR